MRHSRSKPQPAPPPVPERPVSQRPQFSILGMFIVMLAASVTFSGAYYLVRADGDDTTTTLIALLFMLASPMLLVVLVSLVISIANRFQK
jgi:hypothetical protein